MLKKLLITICAVNVLLPSPAMAQKYRLNDKSENNTCKFVHDWFLQVKHKHSVFVTPGGISYATATAKGSLCQAGGDDTLKKATRAAISTCERLGRKYGNRAHCKVVESR